MTCERCGCTEERACWIDVGGPVGDVPCWWVRPGLCVACLEPEELEELQAANPELLEGPPAPPAPLLFDAYGVPVR